MTVCRQTLWTASKDGPNSAAWSALQWYLHCCVRPHLEQNASRAELISSTAHVQGARAAGNNLTQLLDIPEKRPTNLRYADYRHNRIKDFKDVDQQLASFTQLRDLHLDHNCLTSAKGLSSLTSLLELALSNNSLTSCDGLEQLTVRGAVIS